MSNLNVVPQVLMWHELCSKGVLSRSQRRISGVPSCLVLLANLPLISTESDSFNTNQVRNHYHSTAKQ